MEITVKATQAELKEKSFDLVQSMGELLKGVNPELSDHLLKAIPSEDEVFTDPVMREILKRGELEYKRQMELMLADINKVLDKVL